MKKIILGFALVACLFVHAQTSEDTAKKFKPVAIPDNYTKQLDVIYTSGSGFQEKLDLYIPNKTEKLAPAIINIHGGGWVNGSKEQQGGFNGYFKNGFVVANIEYRMTHEAKAPAAVEDARCALAYLIRHAAELNIDVNRIVVMGGSAGGHLALMTGLLANDHRFDNNCNDVKDMKVAAIIDKWGITDVWAWAYCCKSHSAQNWLGDRKADEAFAKTVSPMTYLKKTSPPIFICHGDADSTVPMEESIALHDKLIQLGVKTELMIVPHAGHSLSGAKDQLKVMDEKILVFLKDLGVY